MGRNNALVVSQAVLARMCGVSTRTLQRKLKVLRDQNWIEMRQIGPNGTACAYVVNDRVAWQGPRDGIRYSLFSAQVLVTEDEQPDQAEIGQQAALEHIPSMQPGEQQLPTGPGEDPPAEPPLSGLEPDLPSRGDNSPTE
jgi:DNA-binding transcriptional regulator LsrR (DeoR family)